MDHRTRKELLGETRLSALLSPLLANRWLWIETVVIPLLGLALSYVIAPRDPFFIQAEFPWTWLAPVLVALRYGVVAGVAASGIVLGAWFGFNGMLAPFPKLYFLGGIILVMICGEYSTTWRTRLRRVGELNTYLTERFTRIVDQMNVLRLSYDQLEHDLISRPSTLRDALYELRALVPRLQMLDIDVVNLHWRDWTTTNLDLVHSAGLLAFGWDVQRDGAVDALIAMGIDGLYGDWPDRLVERVRAAVMEVGHRA